MATTPPPYVAFTPTLHHDTYPSIQPIPSQPPTNLRILITGSSKGIGRATAISLAQAGASHIAIHGRNTSDLDETESLIHSAATTFSRTRPTVLKLIADITSLSSVTAMRDEVAKAFNSRLDVLINNAGYLENWDRPFTEADPDEWWKTWEVNVRGTYLVSRAFIPMLLEQGHGGGKGGGTLVNVSSTGGLVTMEGASAYQGSKTAQIRLAGHLDVEYREKGLLVHSVHPGGVATALARGMPKAMQDRLLNDTPELAGDALAWLVRERREWLAGRYLSAQWDVEELEGMKGRIVEGDLLKLVLKT